MILKQLLDYFNLEINLPQYLYEETFNEVFMKGKLLKINDIYKITVKTQKDVIHTMIIDSDDNYPVTILSELPNGRTNGTKFGQSSGDLVYI
jgi:hypothetical protein